MRHFLLGLVFIFSLSQCSLWHRTHKPPAEPEPSTPPPLVLHDAIYKLRLAPNIPRIAAQVSCQLPAAQPGFRWRLQLMTPNQSANGVSISVIDPSGNLPQLELVQTPPLSDEDKVETQKSVTAGAGPYDSVLTIEMSASHQLTVSQRVSLVAIQVSK